MHLKTYLLGIFLFFWVWCCLITTYNPCLSPDGKEVTKAKVKITKVGTQVFGTIWVKCEFSKDQILDHPKFTLKHDTKPTQSRTPSEQTFLREKHDETIDRSRESAIFPFSAIFLGYFLNATSLVPHLELVKYSVWSGNSAKIRPPPVL